MIDLSETLRDKIILDIGCWNGTLLRRLSAHEPRCLVGMDINTADLIEASKAPSENSRAIPYYITGDGNCLPLKNNSVDYVISTLAFYLLNPSRVLPEVKRVLRAGGYFTFTDHTVWYPFKRIFSQHEQPEERSRLCSVLGMSLMLFNGFLYNNFGIPPLFKRFTNNQWVIYQDKKRVRRNLDFWGFDLVGQKTLTEWHGKPVVIQWTAQKKRTLQVV